MIQFIKNLWIKWKYRKYFRSMKTQSEYYNQLARTLQMAYNEFNKPENIDFEKMYIDMPVELMGMPMQEFKNNVEVPDSMHTSVRLKELEVNGKK